MGGYNHWLSPITSLLRAPYGAKKGQQIRAWVLLIIRAMPKVIFSFLLMSFFEGIFPNVGEGQKNHPKQTKMFRKSQQQKFIEGFHLA